MCHWAAKLVGPFPCSPESRGGDLLCYTRVRLLLAAGPIPSSFPTSNAVAGETMCFPGVGDSPRVFLQAQKSQSSLKGEDWLLHGSCLPFRGPFLFHIFLCAC